MIAIKQTFIFFDLISSTYLLTKLNTQKRHLLFRVETINFSILSSASICFLLNLLLFSMRINRWTIPLWPFKGDPIKDCSIFFNTIFNVYHVWFVDLKMIFKRSIFLIQFCHYTSLLLSFNNLKDYFTFLNFLFLPQIFVIPKPKVNY
jgi:hypothetical protein